MHHVSVHSDARHAHRSAQGGVSVHRLCAHRARAASRGGGLGGGVHGGGHTDLGQAGAAPAVCVVLPARGGHAAGQRGRRRRGHHARPVCARRRRGHRGGWQQPRRVWRQHGGAVRGGGGRVGPLPRARRVQPPQGAHHRGGHRVPVAAGAVDGGHGVPGSGGGRVGRHQRVGGGQRGVVPPGGAPARGGRQRARRVAGGALRLHRGRAPGRQRAGHQPA
mmetsp:Transcript_9715/g.24144  ORF Transcript_9715/g.24144 Transcript_9715/m.24144 type:complete len:220 (-) Transcript_9715:1779-2438(-)